MAANQSAQGDQGSNYFWLLILIVGGGMLLWWRFSGVIVTIVFFIRKIEYSLAVGFQDLYLRLVEYIHLPLPAMTKTLEDWHSFMLYTPASQVTFKNLIHLSHDVGFWFLVPACIILLGFAYFLYFHHASARFTKTYNMKSLRASGVHLWPQITPIVKLDLVKQDIDVGPWAMAQLPLDFAKQHELVSVAKDQEGRKYWMIDPAKAHRQFVVQMGPLYKGLDYLPIHIKALAVICVLRAERKRKEANVFLDQIAVSAASSGKLNFSSVELKLQEVKGKSIFSFIERHHAYVLTFMATLLELARTEGVFATSEFLWLKPIDRRLWYMLNVVGRQVPFVEAGGPFAHWLAERKLKRALRTPMVDTAVSALQVALKDVLYVEKGEQWRFGEE